MLFRRFSIIDLTGFLILTGHFGFLWRFPLTTRSQTSVPRSPLPAPRSPFPVLVTSARERSERARESPLFYWSINPPRLLFSYAKSTILQRENRSTISNEKVDGLWTGYEGACYYFSELYKRSQVIMITSWKVYFREGGGDGWVGWHWVFH